MSLVTDLKTHACRHIGLAALIGDRLYPISLPQEPTLPAVTYQVVSDPATYSQSGPSWRQARVQFDAYAATYLAANSVAEQLEAAVNAWRISNPIYTGFQIDRRDIPEPSELSRYRVMVEVSIDH